VIFHDCLDGESAIQLAKGNMKRYLDLQNISEDDIFQTRDAEQEFRQYYLRPHIRLETVPPWQRVSEAEYRSQFRPRKQNDNGTETGTFLANAMMSATTRSTVSIGDNGCGQPSALRI